MPGTSLEFSESEWALAFGINQCHVALEASYEFGETRRGLRQNGPVRDTLPIRATDGVAGA